MSQRDTRDLMPGNEPPYEAAHIEVHHALQSAMAAECDLPAELLQGPSVASAEAFSLMIQSRLDRAAFWRAHHEQRRILSVEISVDTSGVVEELTRRLRPMRLRCTRLGHRGHPPR